MGGVSSFGGGTKNSALGVYAKIAYQTAFKQSTNNRARGIQLSEIDKMPYIVRSGAIVKITSVIIAFGRFFNLDLTDKLRHPNAERVKAAHNDFADLMSKSVCTEKGETRLEELNLKKQKHLTHHDVIKNLEALPEEKVMSLRNDSALPNQRTSQARGSYTNFDNI